MDILYKIFQKPNESYAENDIIILKYNFSTATVKNVNGSYLNNNYHVSNCAKIPFLCPKNTLVDDVIWQHIETKYNTALETIQKDVKDQFEFIKHYKIINYDLYRFYTKIKNIEFIPKTLLHLQTLYNACG